MIVRRAGRPRRFTVVDNTTIEDSRLTWEARGMLIYLLSKPDDWSTNREHLAGQAPNGLTVVRRVLAELETCGYLVRHRTRGEDGRIQWEATIYESPAQTIGGYPADGSSDGGERAVLVSTEVVSTEEQNYALASLDGFEDFWNAYPKRVDKGAARKAFRAALKKTAAATIIAAAMAYAKDPTRTDGFTKHPATWLHAEAWENIYATGATCYDVPPVSYDVPPMRYT